MPYTFTDYNNMVGKRPRQAYWKELQDAVNDMDSRLSAEVSDSNSHESRTDNPHNVTSSQINVITAKAATAPIQDYPFGMTSFQVAEVVATGYPDLYGLIETVYLSEYRNIQYFHGRLVSDTDTGAIYYRKWNPASNAWTEWERLTIRDELLSHTLDMSIHFTDDDRARLNTAISSSTKVEDSSNNGHIKITDANGIVTEINVYTHPSGDGNLHVPTTGTTNAGRVLKAGATAGSLEWSVIRFTEVLGGITDTQHGERGGGALHALVSDTSHGFMSKEDKIKLNAITPNANRVTSSTTNGNILVNGNEQVVYTHPSSHDASMIVESETKRFATDAEKTRWNDTYTKTEVDAKVSSATGTSNWKESVATFNDISVTYPNPSEGWVVSVNETDFLYRYNGLVWEPISANSIPMASQTADGKMSKEDKTKLDAVNENAEVNQNAFSQVQVGDVVISSNTKTDKLVLAAGTNVTLTPNDETNSVVIDVVQSGSDAETLNGHIATDFLLVANNLSEVNAEAARENLGFSMGPTPPANPQIGHRWIDTSV